VQIHPDVISCSVIAMQIRAAMLNRLVIVVQIHATMVSCAINGLHNRETLKRLESKLK
jgi:hypothetical protein